jgi:hypothetical protein
MANLFQKHLLGSPYGPGDEWANDSLEDPEAATAYYVPVGLWVRANDHQEALRIAERHLDVQTDIDTGEAGHIKGGFLLQEEYRRI